MNKIEELQKEINRIREKEQDSLKRKYQYLVGTCFKPSHTSREMITEIIDVNEEVYPSGYKSIDITCGVVSVYYDDTTPIEEARHSIRLNDYTDKINPEDIERSKISKEEFDDFFNDCVNAMRKHTKTIEAAF